MPAIPILIVLAGYWIMYAGVKQTSLLNAWNCAQVAQQSPTPGSVSIASAAGNVGVDFDCTVKPGDTRINLPTGGYMIWRPLPIGPSWLPGWVATANGKLLGPCDLGNVAI